MLIGADPKQLDWDSIIDLTINNLVVNSRKEPIKITLRRCEAIEEEGEIVITLPEDDPPESNVLPSRLFELELSVMDELGFGRSGTAFSTSLESLLECTDENSSPIKLPGLPYLPPLVLKVANESSLQRLGREALNYRELYDLQGVAIPRYYGWFNLTLDDGLSYPGADSIKDPNKPRTLSVLLMERMGDHLNIKETPEEIEDMRDMLVDIALWSVEHDDVRLSNLLRAPSSPPGLPGEVCEVHGREHKFRIIDLESAKLKSDLPPRRIGRDLFFQLRDIYNSRDVG